VLGFDLPGRALGLWWAIRDDVPAERPRSSSANASIASRLFLPDRDTERQMQWASLPHIDHRDTGLARPSPRSKPTKYIESTHRDAEESGDNSPRRTAGGLIMIALG